MQDFLSFINQGWVGIVIGILMALIIYLLSQKNQILACETKSLRLIGKEEQKLPQKIKIFFDDNIVERLTSTSLWIWNHGNETIDGSKIVTDDPIRYVFDNETKILSIKIVTKTREVNKVQVSLLENNEVKLDFDFLDPKDGAKIEIFHTGKKQNPKIKGTIKGMPKGIKYFFQSVPKSKHILLFVQTINKNKKIFSWSIFIVGILMSVIGLLPDSLFIPIDNLLNKSTETKDFRIMFLVAGVAYTCLPLFMIYSERKKYPESLDKDEEQTIFNK